MDSLKLIGSFKASGFRTLYQPIVNNVYSSTSKLSSLYDTSILTPVNNQVLYFLTPSYRNKFLTALTGKTSNIFWEDMVGTGNTATTLAAMTISYSSATSKYIQYPRLNSSIHNATATLDNAKMNTGGIYSLINQVNTANYALTATGGTRQNSVVSIGAMSPSYLNIDTTGVLLRSECYNRNFEVNGFVQIKTDVFSAGASFIVYIYLGTNIVAQTRAYCIDSENNLVINIYAVINTTIADVNKYIDFRIQYIGSSYTNGPAGNILFVVKTI
jgi:hypothetical protein